MEIQEAKHSPLSSTEVEFIATVYPDKGVWIQRLLFKLLVYSTTRVCTPIFPKITLGIDNQSCIITLLKVPKHHENTTYLLQVFLCKRTDRRNQRRSTNPRHQLYSYKSTGC